MYKVGMSLNLLNQREEMFAQCAAAGIDCVEISCSYLKEAEQIDFASIKKWSDKYSVKLWSFHLPFGHFDQIDISSTNDDLRENSVKIMGSYMEKAAGIGIDKFIIHPSGEPIAEEDREDRMIAAKKSLKSLAQKASELGGILCVEDLPRTCLGRDSSDILELISADDRLMVCFDTNHLLKEENADFIKRIGKRIVTLHVSDYDKTNERHWLPGEGMIDWQSLLSALKEIGYSGVWLYEISLQCPKTIIRERDLNCSDFKRNASELFAGEKPTIFSTHKETLGMWE